MDKTKHEYERFVSFSSDRLISYCKTVYTIPKDIGYLIFQAYGLEKFADEYQVCVPEGKRWLYAFGDTNCSSNAITPIRLPDDFECEVLAVQRTISATSELAEKRLLEHLPALFVPVLLGTWSGLMRMATFIGETGRQSSIPHFLFIRSDVLEKDSRISCGQEQIISAESAKEAAFVFDLEDEKAYAVLWNELEQYRMRRCQKEKDFGTQATIDTL